MQISAIVSEALQRGCSIIPTGRNKRPLLESWKPYQSRRSSTEEVAKWTRQLHPPTWAFVTGEVSGIITLDFDGEAGARTMQTLGLRPHRRTPSGGYHVDFRYPGCPVPTLNHKAKRELGERWPGMDIKATGGYCCFAGKTDKGSYEQLRDPELEDVSILPADLRTFLGIIPPRGGRPTTTAAAGELADRLLRDAVEKARNGEGRNGSGFWLACQLRDNAFSEDEAVARLIRYAALVPDTNSKGQAERYTQAEALASVRQAYRASPREPWATSGNGKRDGNGRPAQGAPPTSGPVSDPPGAAAVEDESPEPKTKHFIQTPAGVRHVDEETGSRIFVCSSLKVVADSHDIYGDSWGRVLEWSDHSGRKHRWPMPMQMLAGDGIALRETLLDGGLTIGTGPKARQLLMQYIQSEWPADSVVCTSHIGWHERTFVLPEASISENAKEQIIYQTARRGEHFYNVAGTLEEWKEQIGRPCSGNSRLVLAISMGFAGPLLRLLGVEGGGFHFVGTTSTGKSTAQLVAGSVCGGHGDRGFARSWRFTQNALESMAELHNDGLLILDEIREIPDVKGLDSVMYMLANGAGKGRLNRSMTAQRTLEWRLLFLSSGEIRLSEYAAAAGTRVKAGAEVRLLNIPADAGNGRGIFENIHGAESPRVFAEERKAAATRIYGTPLRAFLDHLVRDYDALLLKAASFMAGIVKDELPPNAAAEVGRALRRIALVATAGEMATDMGITGWEPDEAKRAALRCFEDWITARGGVGQADIEAGIRQVREFLEAHGASRFQSMIARYNRSGDSMEERVIDRAGYWKEDEHGHRQFLIFSEAFKNQLCRGFDYRAIAQELARRKLLERGDGENLARKEYLPNEGRVRVYVVSARILNDGDDDEEAKIT